MLVTRSRLSQSQVSKIIHAQIYNISVDFLVCICLSLRLTVAESVDLLARAERAFSPASKLHQAYIEIIEIYSNPEKCIPENDTMLLEADKYLSDQNLPVLPVS